MTSPRQPLPKSVRVAISLAVVLHLLAVLLPPLSFQTRGPLGGSPAVASLFGPIEGYSQFLYVDRGYAFFAPDPGPSHLIQAAITDRAGVQTELIFPDLQQQWPRLLYHRHFMLSEFLQEIYEPAGPPPELVESEPEVAAMWERSRARYEYVRQSIVEHLKHVHPGHDVAIRRIEHLIPGVIEYQEDPIALTDPRLYQVLLDEPMALDEEDLSAPLSPPETIPPPPGSGPGQRQLESQSGDQRRAGRDESDREHDTQQNAELSDSDPRQVEAELESASVGDEGSGVDVDQRLSEVGPGDTESEDAGEDS